ncbi:FliM/FliN family flagellar motor switch protein [Glaciimonas sp. PAMC28666]|uniref:FliM/FliN family flagellar motor switch protein n=1 Tax=Glaciimonas sp. PAMC28666 TaxID=2807626 RepID=UPI0019646F6E|nr:FliM/FliN family flagellar motor switch protein [Glaciimonas sp. PAMC28666]QRX82140.1 FliM/FliN family flagellar motor switch protein [Glaciimonas sp. PAMC28666]
MLVNIIAYAKESNWCGFVDLADWLNHAAPQLAKVGRCELNGPEQVLRLFNATDQPLHFEPPELSYFRIQASVIQSHEKTRCHVSIKTPQARVWFETLPLGSSLRGRTLLPPLPGIPLRLELLLGSSYVSRWLLRGVACGDVLLIGDIRFELLSGGVVLAHFSINDLGEIALEVVKQQEKKESLIQSQALDEIPLRIDFILQRNTLTVAQLTGLYRGQFLSLDPMSEKKIEISTNGVTLAKGELVELNGQLGVEVTEISSRVKNVK